MADSYKDRRNARKKRQPKERLTSVSRFDQLVNAVRTSFRNQINKLGYDFWDEMMKNEIATSSNPDKASVAWYKQYKKDQDVWLRKGLMKQGQLYLFDYKHPKTESTLDFWDTNPLVLCLGQVRTLEGKTRSIGINLHLLPPKVRRLVMFTIFTKFKTAYKKDLYAQNVTTVQQVKWTIVAKMVEKYGAAFAFRMYIPSLQKNIVEFRVEDFPKAIWIPSARYAKTNPAKLEKAWKSYLKKNRRIAKFVGSQSHR